MTLPNLLKYAGSQPAFNCEDARESVKLYMIRNVESGHWR